MTSHPPSKQPGPTADTHRAVTCVEWVEQSNGDRIPTIVGAVAACTSCGVVYHAGDLLLGRCEGCDNHQS